MGWCEPLHLWATELSSEFESVLLLAKKFAAKKMEKSGSSAETSPKRGRYAGGGTSPDVKVFAAELAMALVAQGVSISTVHTALKETSYSPAPRTLRLHMAALKKDEAPLSAEKATGRAPALTEEQWEIVFGWGKNRFA